MTSQTVKNIYDGAYSELKDVATVVALASLTFDMFVGSTTLVAQFDPDIREFLTVSQVAYKAVGGDSKTARALPLIVRLPFRCLSPI